LEEIPGIGPQMVEKIFASVNSYYSQFEEAQQAEEVQEEESGAQEAEAAPDAGTSAPGEAEPAAGEELAAPVPGENESTGLEAPAEPHNDPHHVSMAGEGEFDTIKDSENAG
jgi:hypothetical protein